MERARALQHRRRRLRQAPARQAGDGLGALRRRHPRARLGRAPGPLQPGRPPAARARGRARATGSPSSSRPPPRPRRSSSAPGSSARSCSRCRSSTATTGSATGSSDSTPKVLVTDAANADRFDASLVDELLVLDERACSPAAPPTTICEDTSADDPAQLYYTSGTTGKAKGIVHAHRYILAHEEFVYCHDVRDGERFHGMGEWAWAAGISPLLGPWRLGAVQYVLQREAGFVPADQLDFLSRHEVSNVFTTPTAMRAMMAIDGRRRALPAGVPDRLLGRRAAQPRGDPLVSRAVRGHGARLLRAHRVLSAVRELPVHGGARGLDGPADARLGRADPRRGREPGRRRASAARSACAPAPTRTTRSATGTCPRRPRRPSAASGSTPRTRRPWTRTATSGTPGAPTT